MGACACRFLRPVFVLFSRLSLLLFQGVAAGRQDGRRRAVTDRRARFPQLLQAGPRADHQLQAQHPAFRDRARARLPAAVSLSRAAAVPLRDRGVRLLVAPSAMYD